MTALRKNDSDNLHFHGGWLIAARAAWIMAVGVLIVLFVISLPPYIEQYSKLSGVALYDTFVSEWAGDSLPDTLDALGFPLWAFVAVGVGSEMAIAISFTAAAIYLFIRSSHDWMGWYTSLMLGVFGLAFTYVISAPSEVYPAWKRVDDIAKSWGWVSFYVFLLIFPSGRLAPRAMRWAIVLISLILPIMIGASFFPDSPLVGPVSVIIWGACLFSMIYRYQRVSGPIERLQTRWLITGIFGLAVVVMLTVFVPLLLPVVREPGPEKLAFQIFRTVLRPVSLIFIPVSLGIAIMRYRLWDIDLIIRRTLIYGLITMVLALIYFGGVVMLQSLFSNVTGGESPLAIVATTLLIAALFAPLRRRVQDFVDRRFYRRKYDMTRTLDEFSATLYEEVDIERLSDSLITVVDQTVKPQHISLWVTDPTSESHS